MANKKLPIEQKRINRLKSLKKYRETHKHVDKAYRLKNADKIKTYLKSYSEGIGRIKRLERRVHANELAIKRRLDNLEKSREKDRALYARRKDKIAENRKLTKDYIQARTWVNNSIRDGKLIRQKCQIKTCDNVGEAHHSDYTEPQKLQWFCKKHHAAWHKLFIAEYGTTIKI